MAIPTEILWLPLSADDDDDSGNSLDATLAGGASIAGGYLVLDGVDGKGTLPDSALLDFGDGSDDSAFSISCFWTPGSVTGNQPLLIRYTTDHYQYRFMTDGTTFRLNLYDLSAGAYISAKSSSVLASGVKSHLVVTYDPALIEDGQYGMKLYADGASVFSATQDSGTYVAMEDTSAVPVIGYSITAPISEAYAQGSMRDLRVFDGVITQGMAKRLYAGGAGTTSTLANLYTATRGGLLTEGGLL